MRPYCRQNLKEQLDKRVAVEIKHSIIFTAGVSSICSLLAEMEPFISPRCCVRLDGCILLFPREASRTFVSEGVGRSSQHMWPPIQRRKTVLGMGAADGLRPTFISNALKSKMHGRGKGPFNAAGWKISTCAEEILREKPGLFSFYQNFS